MWKENWPETRGRFLDWWDRRGLLLGSWGNGLPRAAGARCAVPVPGEPADLESRREDEAYVAPSIRRDMAARAWPAEILPVAWPDLDTLSLAPVFGSERRYGSDNVWYGPCIGDPDAHPPLVLAPANEELARLESLVAAVVRESRGDYLVGMPAIVPNLDVLAELRGAQDLLMDLFDRPEWVQGALREIDTAWKVAFDRVRAVVGAPDGSMAFGYFMLWGMGRVGLLQCDVSATISPAMFDEFVLPRLADECAFLDRSLYHLDGHQCICHLDSILALGDLDAVEWTPDPQVPSGGNEAWYAMYRKILEAGKSVWIAHVKVEEIAPLLDAIGTQGVYLTVPSESEAHFAEARRIAGRYR